MYSPLATPSATRAVLEEFGLTTKKSLGQNFLVNDSVIQKIVELSALGEASEQGEVGESGAPVGDTTTAPLIGTHSGAHKEHVLEVGPGIGTLTLALLPRAAHVTSVERDARLLPVLAKTTQPWANKFTLIHKDALDLCAEDFNDAADFSGVAASCTVANPSTALPTTFIANLPYAVAATLILGYFQKFHSIESATVMVQREVADRICAAHGNKNYGAYTVKLGMFAKAVGQFRVGPNNFFPPPHVESAVVRLNRATPKDAAGNFLTLQDVQAVCTLADAAFFSRRKTIYNSMKSYFASSPAAHSAIFASASNPAASSAIFAGATPHVSQDGARKGSSLSGASANNVASATNANCCLTPANIQEMLAAANIDPRRRGETLSPAEFIALAKAQKKSPTQPFKYIPPTKA